MANAPNTPHQLYEIAESPIHGKGVFAVTKIKKGATIGTPLVVLYGFWVYITPELGKWLNHSWEPNARLVKVQGMLEWDLIALKPIYAGEEITMDYRDTPWFIKKPPLWYV